MIADMNNVVDTEHFSSVQIIYSAVQCHDLDSLAF